MQEVVCYVLRERSSFSGMSIGVSKVTAMRWWMSSGWSWCRASECKFKISSLKSRASKTRWMRSEMLDTRPKRTSSSRYYFAQRDIRQQGSGEQLSYVTLYKKYERAESQLQRAQLEIQQMSEEIELLAKRLEQSGFQSSQVEVNVESKDSMIQRLNMRVTQLKMREDQLLEDNALLEEKLSESFEQGVAPSFSARQSDNFFKREMEIILESKNNLKERLQEAFERENQLTSQLDLQVKQNKSLQQENHEVVGQVERLKQDIKTLKESQLRVKQSQIENEATIYALESTLKANSDLSEIKDQLKQRMDKDLSRIQDDFNKQTHQLESELQAMKRLVEQSTIEATKQLSHSHQLKAAYEQQIANLHEKVTACDLKAQQEQSLVAPLKKQIKKANDELQKSRSEVSTLQEQITVEHKRTDKQDTQLRDKVIVLQNQIANIMRDKQLAQTHFNEDMSELHDKYRTQLQKHAQDNKELEKRYVEAQSEVTRNKSQHSDREDELLKEVKILQKKLQQLMDQQIEKRKSRQASSDKVLSRSPAHKDVLNRSAVTKSLQNVKVLQDALEEERERSSATLQKLKFTQQELTQLRSESQQNLQEMKYKQQQFHGFEDLQHSVSALRHERERVAQQTLLQDQLINDLRDEIVVLNREAQSQQYMQDQAHRANEDTIAEVQSEIQALRHQMDFKQDQMDAKCQEIAILQDERRRFNEQIIYQNLEGDDIKAQLHQKSIDSSQQVQQLQRQIQDILADHKESQEHSYHMKLQMDEQRDHFEELIAKLNNIVEILKEKFQSDLQELQTRQNIYFNQNNNIKLSLSQQKESQQLIQLIQSFSDNVVTQANNQAKVRQAQEQKKQIATQLSLVKDQLQAKSVAMEKIVHENQELLKKVERYKPRNYGQKSQSTTQEVHQDAAPTFIIQFQEGVVAKLQADIITIKTKLRLANATIEQLSLVNKGLEVDCKNMMNQVALQSQQLTLKDTSIHDLQKHHKNEIEKVFKDMTNMQSKIISEDKVMSLQDSMLSRDAQIKELQNELARRKDVNQQHRSDKEDKEQILDTLKSESKQLREENEKLKRQLKESSRKDSNYKDIKEKIDIQKQTDKQLMEENKSLLEKMKVLKVDVQRKDAQNKELKERLEELQSMRHNDSDKKESAQLAKRHKEEIQRKDQALKHYKQKVEEKSAEVEVVKHDHVQKYSTSVHELEREQRKSDQLRVQQKKQETHVNMLLFLLKRLYRENFTQLQQGKQITQSNAKTSVSMLSQYQKSKPNLSRFSESMNILNISPDDLEQFLEPNAAATKSDVSLKKTTMRHEDLDRFEEDMSNLDNLDVDKVFESIQTLIQDRINDVKN